MTLNIGKGLSIKAADLNILGFRYPRGVLEPITSSYPRDCIFKVIYVNAIPKTIMESYWRKQSECRIMSHIDKMAKGCPWFCSHITQANIQGLLCLPLYSHLIPRLDASVMCA